MSIFLVRHTAPNITPGIIYAATNVPVHDGEFKRVIPLLDAALPESALIVTSPLTRCRRLADFLAMSSTPGTTERTVILDPRLIERDLGRWTGKRWEDIPRAEARAFDADFLDHWPPPVETENGPVLRGLNVHPRLGAGESVRAMQTRVVEGFEAAWDIAEGRNLVIVSHAGPIAAIIAHWLTEPLRRGIQPSPDCGDVVQLAYVDGRQRAFIARRANAPQDSDNF
jgi:alpha-ribazole phosphatase